jgi:hypothetical protein
MNVAWNIQLGRADDGTPLVVVTVRCGDVTIEAPMTAKGAFDIATMLEAASRDASGKGLETKHVH